MDEQPTLDAPESWAAGAPAVQAHDLARGASIDRYIVVNKLGSGAMGIVYAAYDPELDRRVAIKLMRPAGVDSVRADETRERTIREARGMAQIAHPNVVAIYDVGPLGHGVFLTMELIEGGTLRDWLGERRPWREVIDMFVGAGRGLAAAHHRGLVHRDFKPDNVMVGADGRARVTDFGLVRDLAEAPRDEAHADADAEDLDACVARLTRTGAFVGTPQYMAPEQFDQQRTDERADQFSFCVALFEALFGAEPYPGDTLRSRLQALRAGAPPVIPRDTDVPVSIQRAVLRGLSIDPARRFSDMNALLDEVAPKPGPSRARRAVAVMAGLALLAGGAVAYRAATSSRRADQVCKGAEGRLAAVWSAQRASDLTSAFAAVGGDLGNDASERVMRVLNEYGASWAEARTEACEATHTYKEQSVDVMQIRMRCLDRRLGELDALVDELVDADDSVVRESVTAVNQLEPVTSCADAKALEAEVAPPPDPEIRLAVEQLEPAFARLRSMHLAGRFADGDSLAKSQLAAADATGFRPTEARAHYWAGAFAIAMAEYERADRLLEAGVWFAEASGDDTLAATMWIERLVGLGQERSQLGRVESLERRATAAVERLHTPPGLVMRLNTALGVIAHEGGRFEDALRLFGVARAAAERGDESAELGMAAALTGMGRAEAELGKLDDARTHHELALAVYESVLGPLHPQVGKTLGNHGATYGEMGEAPEAIETYRRAVEVLSQSLGSEHPATVHVMIGLANELVFGGKADEALPLFTEGLARLTTVHGENSQSVASVLNGRALALRHLDRHAESRDDLLRSLAILEQIGGDDAAVGVNLANIGDSFLQSSQPDEAIIYYRRSLAAVLASNGARSLRSAYVMRGLGEALLESGRAAESVPLFESALEIRIEAGASASAIGSAQESLARALVRVGNTRRGCALWLEAQTGYEALGGERYQSAARELANERAAAGCR